LGATLGAASGFPYFGDESNQMAPVPGHVVVGVHAVLQVERQAELFAGIDNLFDVKYANYGILGDPTGVGAPGIPAGSTTNGAGVDNRFQSPAAPFAVFAGVRLKL